MNPEARPPAMTAGTVPTAIATASRWSGLSIARAHGPIDEAADELHDLAAEVGDRGDQRAGVKGDVEGLVEVRMFDQERVVLQPRDEDQVAEEEIGRNSVSPWTIPSSRASSSDIGGAS